MEHEESTLKPQDSTPTSINISRETKPNHDLEAKVEKTKSFAERWKTNRFWLVRVSYHVLHWVVVMAIGAFIAWLVALLFI